MKFESDVPFFSVPFSEDARAGRPIVFGTNYPRRGKRREAVEVDYIVGE